MKSDTYLRVSAGTLCIVASIALALAALVLAGACMAIYEPRDHRSPLESMSTDEIHEWLDDREAEIR